ncbi:DUF6233 domain-containing protein [Streptomyces sp. NPDC001815]|uniref:DUF6233 domain-containing protein n=1 Tax=Streptomyces sp. NPDC001815 TaxID=3154526 RepID=UPI00332C8DC7
MPARQPRSADDPASGSVRQEAVARAAHTLPLAVPGRESAVRRTGSMATPGASRPGHSGVPGEHTKPRSREQALRAVTGRGAATCPHCRPHTDSGVL